jgi:squalene-hopene/tetraprenyl-beta-curcumene cyclase
MGAQGLYYYYHTMAKALTISKMEELPLADGKKANWRQDLSKAMFNAQKPDGSWLNDNARWMEKDPILSTAYACLTLAQISRGL